MHRLIVLDIGESIVYADKDGNSSLRIPTRCSVGVYLHPHPYPVTLTLLRCDFHTFSLEFRFVSYEFGSLTTLRKSGPSGNRTHIVLSRHVRGLV